MNVPANPLLARGIEIAFPDITPAHVAPAVEVVLAHAREALAHVRAPRETPRTWQDTVAAIDEATEPVERVWGLVEHLASVRWSEELDAAHQQAQPAITAFFTELGLDERLFDALTDYAATPEAQALTGPPRRYLDKALEAFRRQGADLPAPSKARLAQIHAALAQKTTTFSSNLLRATQAWSLHLPDASRLSGVPEAIVSACAHAATQAGQEGFLLTLSPPIVTAILTYAHDRDLREQLWRAWSGRCTSGDTDNKPVIAEILALREELASLLGYATFADFVLEPRMARTLSTASDFVADLHARARGQFIEETTALQAFASTNGGPSPLCPWDVGYYADLLRKQTLDFDEEALRPYLPLDTVRDGLFDLFHKLYGVRISSIPLATWHESVATYAIDDADGTRLGVFHIDFVPRADKRQGAWMNALVTGGPNPDGSFSPHVGLIAGHVTPAGDGKPALLTHREAETIAHEMGHLVHHLLSRVAIKGQSGTQVAWDFVELPSQIMENWLWERDGLRALSGHWQSAEPVPDALFDRLHATRTFRGASFVTRQLGFAAVDLALHGVRTEALKAAPVEAGEAFLADYAPFPAPKGYCILTSFGHLFADATGYAAGYYSYLWAAVLDADAFERFREEGIFSRSVGTAFREALLSKGDTDAPEALFRNFRGRDATPDALLKRLGLHEKALS